MKARAPFPISFAVGLILLVGAVLLEHFLFSPKLPLVGVIQWTGEIKTFEDERTAEKWAREQMKTNKGVRYRMIM